MQAKSTLRKALYLDDVRTPTETLPNAEPWVVVRDYEQFCAYITEHGIPDVVSFDHDLSKEHTDDYFTQMLEQQYQIPNYESYKELTGLECARFMIRYSEQKNVPLKQCVVHSHNPVGAQNILTEINGYKKHMGWPADCYQHRFPFEINK